MGKREVLESTLKQIQKAYGEGSIMWLGDGAQTLQVETVPSGSLALDIALGVGGIPRGRIIEIFGMESSGKTTLALHMIAEVQKRGGTAAFIDAEHALDPTYSRALGVDLDHILISHDIHATRYEAPDLRLSDHLPVTVEIELPEGVRVGR